MQIPTHKPFSLKLSMPNPRLLGFAPVILLDQNCPLDYLPPMTFHLGLRDLAIPALLVLLIDTNTILSGIVC
jgi:hypothetical protein